MRFEVCFDEDLEKFGDGVFLRIEVKTNESPESDEFARSAVIRVHADV